MRYAARVRYKLKDAHGPMALAVVVTAPEETPMDEIRKAMRREVSRFIGKSGTVASTRAIEPIPLPES